jgi:hypothetical protein
MYWLRKAAVVCALGIMAGCAMEQHIATAAAMDAGAPHIDAVNVHEEDTHTDELAAAERAIFS